MASSVFYKFKSQKDESRVTFDGTGISVFDLKKEIILANNLGKANDFDLAVYDRSSNEEYKDDATIIPRASSVIIKRVFAKPGKGKAAMYIGGTAGSSTGTSDSAKSNAGASGSHTWHKGGNISKRFDVKEELPSNTPPKAPTATISGNIAKEDEAAAMAAMFQAQTANWEETQEKMSHAVRIYSNPRGGGPGRGGKPYQAHHHHQPERPLPPSYVCYRCGQKGHWIQDCPTNNDREYDNRPRIKRTTGIPRSFLKAVENPTTGQLGHGVMVTPEGGYVVAQPDSVSWQKQVSRPKGLSEADIRERTPSDSNLTCPIDNKLFKDAVKTPCCGTLYCEECIQTHLLERDFICPSCSSKIPSLDKLIIDKPMRTKVMDYIDKEIERSHQEGEEELKPAPPQPSSNGEAFTPDDVANEDLYTEHQPGTLPPDVDVSQIVASSIPHIQAQITQIARMLHNPSLPLSVRQQTEMKHHQLQMELRQAQMAAAFIQAGNAAAAQFGMSGLNQLSGMNAMPPGVGMGVGVNVGMGAGGFGPMGGPMVGGPMGGGGGQQQDFRNWNTPFPNQQPAGQDSAYQRLPLNNRRRNLKRERPSDFLEVAGSEHEAKVARYWE